MWSGIVPVMLGGALDDGTVLLTSSGAFAEFNTCIILGSLKSRISTSIPKRFISFKTIYRRQEMNFMQIYKFFFASSSYSLFIRVDGNFFPLFVSSWIS